jgi:hypothetical protein
MRRSDSFGCGVKFTDQRCRPREVVQSREEMSNNLRQLETKYELAEMQGKRAKVVSWLSEGVPSVTRELCWPVSGPALYCATPHLQGTKLNTDDTEMICLVAVVAENILQAFYEEVMRSFARSPSPGPGLCSRSADEIVLPHDDRWSNLQHHDRCNP